MERILLKDRLGNVVAAYALEGFPLDATFLLRETKRIYGEGKCCLVRRNATARLLRERLRLCLARGEKDVSEVDAGFLRALPKNLPVFALALESLALEKE